MFLNDLSNTIKHRVYHTWISVWDNNLGILKALLKI